MAKKFRRNVSIPNNQHQGLTEIESTHTYRMRYHNFHSKVVGEMDKKCNSLINKISGVIAPIFVMPQLRDLVEVTIDEKTSKVNRHGIDLHLIDKIGKGLINDMAIFRGRLVTIYIHATVEDRTTPDQFTEFEFHEKYLTWMNSFISMVVNHLQTVEEAVNSKVPDDLKINLGISAIQGLINE